MSGLGLASLPNASTDTKTLKDTQGYDDFSYSSPCPGVPAAVSREMEMLKASLKLYSLRDSPRTLHSSSTHSTLNGSQHGSRGGGVHEMRADPSTRAHEQASSSSSQHSSPYHTSRASSSCDMLPYVPAPWKVAAPREAQEISCQSHLPTHALIPSH